MGSVEQLVARDGALGIGGRRWNLERQPVVAGLERQLQRNRFRRRRAERFAERDRVFPVAHLVAYARYTVQPVIDRELAADGVHDVLSEPAVLEVCARGGHVGRARRPEREARDHLEVVAEQFPGCGLCRVDGERRLGQQRVRVSGSLADLDDQSFEDRLQLETETGDSRRDRPGASAHSARTSRGVRPAAPR